MSALQCQPIFFVVRTAAGGDFEPFSLFVFFCRDGIMTLSTGRRTKDERGEWNRDPADGACGGDDRVSKAVLSERRVEGRGLGRSSLRSARSLLRADGRRADYRQRVYLQLAGRERLRQNHEPRRAPGLPRTGICPYAFEPCYTGDVRARHEAFLCRDPRLQQGDAKGLCGLQLSLSCRRGRRF